jgi:hypothetical protein
MDVWSNQNVDILASVWIDLMVQKWNMEISNMFLAYKLLIYDHLEVMVINYLFWSFSGFSSFVIRKTRPFLSGFSRQTCLLHVNDGI